MQDDPVFVEALLEQYPEDDEERAARYKPSTVDHTTDSELFTKIFDRLGGIAMLIAELPTPITQRHAPPRPHPRPETELDRRRAQLALERDLRYFDRLDDLVTRGQALYAAALERGEDPYGPAEGERQQLVTDL